MSFTIRSFNLPADYPRLAELFSSNRPEPVTVTELEEQDSRIPEPGPVRYNDAGQLISHCRDRMAAVDETGYLVAWADIWRAPWSPPGHMYGHVLVDHRARRQGLGRLLLDRVESIARAKRAEEILTEIREGDAGSIAWVQRHGYALERHLFESTLDLAGFDEGRYGGVIDAVRAGGIRFTTLAAEPGEAMERSLYESILDSEQDIPGFLTHMPFEEWRKWTIEGPLVPHEGVIMALDGAKVVGTAICRRLESGALYNEYTGVMRAYRGRKIALAMKLLAVEHARSAAAPYLRTNNDSQNKPMLAINQKMGYLPEPGMYRIQKRLR